MNRLSLSRPVVCVMESSHGSNRIGHTRKTYYGGPLGLSTGMALAVAAACCASAVLLCELAKSTIDAGVDDWNVDDWTVVVLRRGRECERCWRYRPWFC